MPYRDTTTGLKFENKIKIKYDNCIDLSQYKLWNYLQKRGTPIKTILSKGLRPDEAYFNEDTGEFTIFEKKYQETPGSADEKPQTCGFKIQQFRKIGNAIGAKSVKYIYVFNDWFHRSEYKDMLEYIKTVDGCDYIFEEDIYAA